MRKKLMTILEESEGNEVYDSTTIDWTTFNWSLGYTPHNLTKAEILKPNLITYAYWGNTYYEDILLLLNNIEDVWEVVVGTEIRIPKLIEVEKFMLDNTK